MLRYSGICGSWVPDDTSLRFWLASSGMHERGIEHTINALTLPRVSVAAVPSDGLATRYCLCYGQLGELPATQNNNALVYRQISCSPT